MKIDSQFLFFMHIPKTAGTTLRKIIDLQYGEENVLTYYNQTNRSLIDNLDALLQKQPNYRALVGHFQYGAHAVLPEKTSYVTFMRDPIQRTISDYYERLVRTPEKYKLANGKIMNIGEMITAFPNEMQNHQTKYLAGVPFDQKINEVDCARAVENITSNFCFCGIVEYFEESILIMSQILGWPICLYKSLNIGSGNLHRENEHHLLIEETNKFDLILYKIMYKKFQNLLNERGGILKKSAVKYKKMLLKFSKSPANNLINAKKLDLHLTDL